MLKLFLFLSMIVLGMLGKAAHGQSFTGTYALTLPQGAVTLALQQDAEGTLVGTLVGPGATLQARGTVEDGEVIGVLTGPQSRAEFEVYYDEDEDQYYLVVTPMDAQGNLMPAQETEYEMERVSNEAEVQAVPSPAPPPAPDAGLDASLVGIWATQVITNTPGGSLASQLIMELHPDGRFVQYDGVQRGSVGGGSLGSDGGAVEQGYWRTQNNILQFKMEASPWVPLARYYLEGSQLLLTFGDGDRQLWYRQ